MDGFWSPLFSSKEPILICSADQDGSAKSASALLDANSPVQASASGAPHIMSADNLAPVVGLSGMLSSRGHAERVETQGRATFSDLGNGPVVLIGAFNNFWTLQFTRNLHFHFQNDPEHIQLWIEDRQDPSARKWTLDASAHEVSEDYALVARYMEPTTHQWTVVVAGLGAKANIGAIRFLMSEERMEELDRAAPRDWRKKNIEFILRTYIVGGDAGPSQIEAVHTW